MGSGEVPECTGTAELTRNRRRLPETARRHGTAERGPKQPKPARTCYTEEMQAAMAAAVTTLLHFYLPSAARWRQAGTRRRGQGKRRERCGEAPWHTGKPTNGTRGGGQGSPAGMMAQPLRHQRDQGPFMAPASLAGQHVDVVQPGRWEFGSPGALDSTMVEAGTRQLDAGLHGEKLGCRERGFPGATAKSQRPPGMRSVGEVPSVALPVVEPPANDQVVESLGETAPAPPEMQRGHGWRVVRSWPASGDVAKVWEKEREAPLAVQQAAEAPAGRRKLVSTGAFNPPMGEVGTRQLEADQPAERSSAGPLGGAKRVWMGLRFKEMEVRETALVAGQGRRHDILCKGGRWETADERRGSDPRRRAWAHWARWAGRWLLRAVARGGEADGGNGVGGGGVSSGVSPNAGRGSTDAGSGVSSGVSPNAGRGSTDAGSGVSSGGGGDGGGVGGGDGATAEEVAAEAAAAEAAAAAEEGAEGAAAAAEAAVGGDGAKSGGSTDAGSGVSSCGGGGGGGTVGSGGGNVGGATGEDDMRELPIEEVWDEEEERQIDEWVTLEGRAGNGEAGETALAQAKAGSGRVEAGGGGGVRGGAGGGWMGGGDRAGGGGGHEERWGWATLHGKWKAGYSARRELVPGYYWVFREEEEGETVAQHHRRLREEYPVWFRAVYQESAEYAKECAAGEGGAQARYRGA